MISVKDVDATSSQIPSELPSPVEAEGKKGGRNIKISLDFVQYLREKGRKGESYEDVLWRLIHAKPFDMVTDEERRRLETIKLNLNLPDDLSFLRYSIEDHYAERTKAFITGFNTIASSFGDWCRNIAENMQVIRAGRDVEDWARAEPKNPTLIIAAGPSVWRDECRQLKTVSKSSFKGSILVCDRILRKVLQNGILPQHYESFTVVTVDSKEVVASWFEDALIDKYADSIKMVSITSIHPKVLEAFKGEKFFFNGVIGDKILPNASHIHKLMTEKTVISTLGCVGSTCYFLAKMAGKPQVAFIGQDFGWPGDTQLRETEKFEAYCQMYGGRVHRDEEGRVSNVEFPTTDCVARVKALYKRGIHPDFKTSFLSDYIFDSLRDSLVNFIEHDRERPEVCNCTEGGCLWGEGVKCMRLEEWLKRFSN